MKAGDSPHPSGDGALMDMTSHDAASGVSPDDAKAARDSETSDSAGPDLAGEPTDGGTVDSAPSDADGASTDGGTVDSAPSDAAGAATDGGTADSPSAELGGMAPEGGASDLAGPSADAAGPEAGAGGAGGSGADAGLSDGPSGSSDGSGDGPAHVPPPATGYVEMKLYDGDPPNLLRNAPAEQVSGNGSISNVSIPTLRRYPMDESKSTGAAFVVFPGGGYTGLDFETHATALAKRLGPLGFAVFGLKYRVGGGSSNVERDALLDANRAIRLVRSHAAEWGIAEDRIGVISYSAGSDLDMRLVAGGYDAGKPTATDPVERKSSRPDFVASMCTWAHGGTTSPYKFTADTPPVYLCHAQDDTTAPIAVANQIDQQLQAVHVLEHLEVYPKGGHSAFHVGDPNAPGRDWPDKYLPWLRTNKLIP
jgi:endo-1,4-beta-xylanase